MKQRDIELLSSYLDGQLGSADSARLEARLRTEPELRSVLQDLRGARSLLRQLPMRKAPRNFTLTPQMVGKNPPLPRSYPVFRFAATLASILLFFTFGLNIMGRQLAAKPPEYGMGGEGGGAETLSVAATEAPALEAPAAPALSTPMLTATAPGAESSTRVMDTAVAKESGTEAANAASSGLAQQPPQAQPQPPQVKTVSPVWQWLLAGIALISLFIMALMRQLSRNRWRRGA